MRYAALRCSQWSQLSMTFMLLNSQGLHPWGTQPLVCIQLSRVHISVDDAGIHGHQLGEILNLQPGDAEAGVSIALVARRC